ncbi:FxsC protein [Streptomyces sp. NPDC005374]|uniref:FxsC protein n=1 Tax=Streptomyces sp. NPDC005374 TaxID=3364713 RepID=UPI0036C4DC31
MNRTRRIFVSYASALPPGSDLDEGRPAADKNVKEFYTDLMAAVASMSGSFVARLDAAGHGGPDAARALHRCHVFVPLITRRYFTDVRCGRQWYAFANRSHRGVLAPVLWTPVPTTAYPIPLDLDLPVPGLRTQPVRVENSAAERYAQGGLYGLRQYSDHPEYYDQCIRRIAQFVVEAANQAPDPVPGSAEFTELDDIPDAFAASFSHPLGIVVLAPDIHHLPPGRRDTKYGPEPRDWQPFSDGYGISLAERTAELARNIGFAPQIRTYDEIESVFLGQREAAQPWVLILDPWILHDRTVSARLRAFDSRDLPWVTVMTPLADDAQTRGAREQIDALLREALPRRLSGGRAIQRAAVAGIDNSEAFTSRFMELADSAAHQYLNRIPLRSSAAGQDNARGDQEAQP